MFVLAIQIKQIAAFGILQYKALSRQHTSGTQSLHFEDLSLTARISWAFSPSFNISHSTSLLY